MPPGPSPGSTLPAVACLPLAGRRQPAYRASPCKRARCKPPALAVGWLTLTDPYERSEVISGSELQRLSDRYYVFTSEDGRCWLLSNYLVGSSIEDVHRGMRVSVHVARMPKPSADGLCHLEGGKAALLPRAEARGLRAAVDR